MALELSEQQQAFLDWLVSARDEGDTQERFAERIGVAPATLTRWKKDPLFLKMWEERLRETYAHPDRMRQHMDALHRESKKGDVRALELYWKLVDRMSPDASQADSKLDQLSDEDLDKLIAEQATAERARR